MYQVSSQLPEFYKRYYKKHFGLVFFLDTVYINTAQVNAKDVVRRFFPSHSRRISHQIGSVLFVTHTHTTPMQTMLPNIRTKTFIRRDRYYTRSLMLVLCTFFLFGGEHIFLTKNDVNMTRGLLVRSQLPEIGLTVNSLFPKF